MCQSLMLESNNMSTIHIENYSRSSPTTLKEQKQRVVEEQGTYLNKKVKHAKGISFPWRDTIFTRSCDHGYEVYGWQNPCGIYRLVPRSQSLATNIDLAILRTDERWEKIHQVCITCYTFIKRDVGIYGTPVNLHAPPSLLADGDIEANPGPISKTDKREILASKQWREKLRMFLFVNLCIMCFHCEYVDAHGMITCNCIPPDLFIFREDWKATKRRNEMCCWKYHITGPDDIAVAIREMWQRDLTADGDVEGNPGPPFTDKRKLRDLIGHLETLNGEKDRCFLRKYSSQALRDAIHFCPKTEFVHVMDAFCLTSSPSDDAKTLAWHGENIEADYKKYLVELEEKKLEASCHEVPPPSSLSSFLGPCSEVLLKEEKSVETVDLSLSPSPGPCIDVQATHKSRSAPTRRQSRNQAKILERARKLEIDEHNEDLCSAFTEALQKVKEEEMVEKYKRSQYSSCPDEWKLLYDKRAKVKFGNGLRDAFSFRVAGPFTTFWRDIDPDLIPCGTARAAIGWRNFVFYRPDAPCLKTQNFDLRKNELRVKAKDEVVEVLVGPLPYANDIGLFYDELWLPEHYAYLRESGYSMTESDGELACYERKGEPWTNVPERFVIQHMPRTALTSLWWGEGKGSTLPLFLDLEVPEVFTCGVALHRGSFTTACRVLIGLNYNYVKYWSWVVTGTAVFQSFRHNATNLTTLQMFRKDLDFFETVRGVFSFSSHIDQLSNLLFQECTVEENRKHALCPAAALLGTGDIVRAEQHADNFGMSHPTIDVITPFVQEQFSKFQTELHKKVEQFETLKDSFAADTEEAEEEEEIFLDCNKLFEESEEFPEVNGFQITRVCDQLQQIKQEVIDEVQDKIEQFHDVFPGTVVDSIESQLDQTRDMFIARIRELQENMDLDLRKFQDDHPILCAQFEDLMRRVCTFAAVVKCIVPWAANQIHENILLSHQAEFAVIEKELADINAAAQNSLKQVRDICVNNGLIEETEEEIDENEIVYISEVPKSSVYTAENLPEEGVIVFQHFDIEPPEIPVAVQILRDTASFLYLPLNDDYLAETILREREGVRNLRSAIQEWNTSSARLFGNYRGRFYNTDCDDESVFPVILQGAVSAVINDQEVSVYNQPPFDETRIQITWKEGFSWEERPLSFARPEVIFWWHIVDGYLPHPHANPFATIYRCGKTALKPKPEVVASYRDFWLIHLRAFQACVVNLRDEGKDDVTLEHLLQTVAKMPSASRQKRLLYHEAYQTGSKKDVSSSIHFFVKTDEFLYKHVPRSLFNGTDPSFCFNQGVLVDVKQVLKAVEADFSFPRPWHFKINGLNYYLYYMADSDVIQDSEWYDFVRTQNEGVHIAVGGDDNLTVAFFQGHLFEIEADVSMCDQSHHAHFRNFFLNFLRMLGIPEHVIDDVKSSYTCNACFRCFENGVMLVVKFLESQLKTGVGHTSLANTMTVASLVIFALQLLFSEDFNPKRNYVALFNSICASLGMQMKTKIFIDSERSCVTFHKRYFVQNYKGKFVACSLPGTTLVKMTKVRAPLPMAPDAFWKILAGGCLSRQFSPQNPLIRLIITKLLTHYTPDQMYIDNPYSSAESDSEEWWMSATDGLYDHHMDFMVARYGISYEEIESISCAIEGMRCDRFYSCNWNVELRALIVRMWEVDNA